MTTPAKRINEFTKRQIAYDSSMIANLSAVNGKWHYRIYAYLCDGETRMLLDKSKLRVKAGISRKYRVIQGKYNGEDPKDLFAKAREELKVKKIKCGVPVPLERVN